MKKILILMTLLLSLSGCSLLEQAAENSARELEVESTTEPIAEEIVEPILQTEESVQTEETQTEFTGEKEVMIVDNLYMQNQDPTLPVYTTWNGVIDPTTIEPTVLERVGLQSVVNKFNALPEDYVPDDLVEIVTNHSSRPTMELRSEAASAWTEMERQAKNEGITMVLISAYRTRDDQQGLFDNYYRSNPENASQYSAHPRRSEHEMGLALDISYDIGFPEDFYNTEVGQFLQRNATDYGFILRYPEGKEDITGYAYESWHYRYVGVDLAKELTEKNITLEEYYHLDRGAIPVDYVLEVQDSIDIVEETPEVEEEQAFYLEVTNSFLNVRSVPDTSSDETILGVIYLGDRVQWTGRDNGWYTIIYNGETAYVAEQYVQEIYE